MRQRAFTLIELLIVIAIMSTVMSLVGPLAVEQFHKIQAQLEWRSVMSVLENSRKKAYLTNSVIEVQADGKAVTVVRQAVAETTLDLEYVFFTPATLQINANGFITPAVITGQVGDKTMVHTFTQWKQ